MANRLRGEAEASFDGTTLMLVMDNEAWVTIEDVLDQSYLDIVIYMIATENAKLSIKNSVHRALLYGATREHHRELMLPDCGELMMRHGAAIFGPLGIAMRGSLPWSEKAPGEALPAATPATTADGDGTTS